ncbi:hypothetical protein H0X10_04580 [Candidatus Saccharibacteria bacterium]|nr:hypothetical protein [Candidatus Saccharibacteria bacterium]
MDSENALSSSRLVVPNLPVSKRVGSLLRSMEYFVQNPPNGERDDIESAFYSAVLDQQHARPDFGELIQDFVAARPELTTTHTRYLLRSSFQKIAVRQHADYPEGFNQTKWKNIISSYLDDSSIKNEIVSDLHNRHLQTNIKDRYKSLPVIIGWMRANKRIGHEVNILDFGSSRNHGLKHLSLMDKISGVRFSDTVVVEPISESPAGSQDTLVNERHTAAFNHHQNMPVNLRVGLGIDKESIDDPTNAEWARANLTHREFKEHKVDEYDLLDIMPVSQNVRFQQYDLLDADQSKFFEVSPDDQGGFDIVSMFTMLNQMSETDRHRFLRLARRYADPMGVVVVQDFARVNQDLSTDIEFLDADWNKGFSHRTIVLDMLKPVKYQEAFLYATGRCDKVQIAVGETAVKLVAGGNTAAVNLAEFLDVTSV